MTYDNPCAYCSAPCEGKRHASWQECSEALRAEALRLERARKRQGKFLHMIDYGG